MRRAVSEMLVEDDPRRRQGVEIRRGDPGVAIAANVGRLKAANGENRTLMSGDSTRRGAGSPLLYSVPRAAIMSLPQCPAC